MRGRRDANASTFDRAGVRPSAGRGSAVNDVHSHTARERHSRRDLNSLWTRRARPRRQQRLPHAGAKGRSQALVRSGPGGCRGRAWASILDDHLGTHPPEPCLRASRRRLRHFAQRCLPLMSPASTRTPQSASLSPRFATCTKPSSPQGSEKLSHVSAKAPSLCVLSGSESRRGTLGTRRSQRD